ncbi:hypothetical protein OF83DRAFT_439213 [Amylostereum chailletii]|nr:hypothetical protein OF83DRAFT_439213 [Amylostereum chailletii]
MLSDSSLANWDGKQSSASSTSTTHRSLNLPVVHGTSSHEPEQRGALPLIASTDMSDKMLGASLEGQARVDASTLSLPAPTISSNNVTAAHDMGKVDASIQMDVTGPYGHQLEGVHMQHATMPPTAFSSSAGPEPRLNVQYAEKDRRIVHGEDTDHGSLVKHPEPHLRPSLPLRPTEPATSSTHDSTTIATFRPNSVGPAFSYHSPPSWEGTPSSANTPFDVPVPQAAIVSRLSIRSQDYDPEQDAEGSPEDLTVPLPSAPQPNKAASDAAQDSEEDVEMLVEEADLDRTLVSNVARDCGSENTLVAGPSTDDKREVSQSPPSLVRPP